jgi:hypothetical protein
MSPSRLALSLGLRLGVAVALASAPACGRVTVVSDDASVARDAGDGGGSPAGDAPGAGDGTSSDAVPATCPAAIAPCVMALQTLRSMCRGAGACQTETEMSLRRVNDCYADGVRVYFDPGLTTVLRGDGRLCYTVEGGLSGGTIDQTVMDPAGGAVLRLTRNVNLSLQTITCGASAIDVADSDRPCGDTALLPQDLACVPGACVRP